MSFCCRRPTALINCALVLLALAPAALCAQTIRGVVVNRASVPVSGVVVLLIDSLAATSAQALSNERGEFRLVAPRAGTYRTRALRIGFRPEFSQPFTLRSGEEVQQRTTLDGVQLALDTMHVLDQNVCRLSADSAAVTFAVWEQIRAALTAAQLTRSAQSVLTTSVAYDRTLDETAHHVREQHSVVSTAYGARAWHSLTPDSLHRVGYVVSENDLATTYYAPDLDVLLSDLFLRDHCFRLTTKRDKSVLGLAFQSTSARKRVAEVRGTLWIDRKTSALRNLEFGYENIPAEQQGEAGGEMNFVALKNGEWAISKWNIRMPEIARVTRPASMGGVGLQLVSIRVNGGELALATKGGDTLWRGIPIALNGTVVDSLTGKPVSVAHIQLTGTALNTDADSKGHFSISGVLPGEYTVDVHTASLDSVSSVHRTMTSVTDGVAKIEIRVP
ncbi:MAG: carboxypeptidase regulatory-like domain-containing protein, partial [Gemmatimonadaceae bacterium]